MSNDDQPITLEDTIGIALHAAGLPFNLAEYLKKTSEIRDHNDRALAARPINWGFKRRNPW